MKQRFVKVPLGLWCVLLLQGAVLSASSEGVDEPCREPVVITGISVDIDFYAPLSADGFNRQVGAFGPAFTIELHSVYAADTVSILRDGSLEEGELRGSVRWKFEGCELDEPVYVTDMGEVVRGGVGFKSAGGSWMKKLWASITESMLPRESPQAPSADRGGDEWGDRLPDR